ncbi:MAG: hypothetical protein VYC42_06335 [Pseudomonadota bacterium]|nr:hypothetical protein [Pseudomonadota bacterium]
MSEKKMNRSHSKLFFLDIRGARSALAAGFLSVALSLSGHALAADGGSETPVGAAGAEQPMPGPFKPDTPLVNPPESEEVSAPPAKKVEGLGNLEKEEQALRARVEARWDALIKVDMAKVYEFATPTYRKANSLNHLNNQYAAQVQRDSIRIDSVRFEEGTPPSAKVALTLYFTTSGFGGSDPLKLDAPVTDTWVKVDGEWWYVEPR